jgi:CRISPR/Cas system-associated protein endoribonuclease Cas2
MLLKKINIFLLKNGYFCLKIAIFKQLLKEEIYVKGIFIGKSINKKLIKN